MRTAYLSLVLVLLASVLLRLPAFFQPDWYGDEGIFQAVAHAWRTGHVLYAETWDNKPPGIFSVYALADMTGFGMIAVRTIDLCAMLATQVFVFELGRRRLGPLQALAASALVGLLMATPIIEGQLANTESFLIVFTSLGMLLLVMRIEESRLEPKRLFLPGVVFGLAGLFKQVAVLDGVAALIFVLLYFRGSWKQALALTLGGLSLPLIITAAFAAAGAFSAFWSGNVGFMLQYRGATPTLHQALIMLLPLSLAMPYAIATKPWSSRSLDGLLPLWLAFSAIGVTASGKAYPHYLIQLVPAASLVAAGCIFFQLKALPRASVAAGMIIAGLLVYHVFLGPWGYVAWNKEPDHSRDYYRNFVDYMDGDRSRQDYEAFFDPSAPARLRLIEQVKDLNLQPPDVFVWGNLPWVYPEAGLKDATPFPVLFSAAWNEGGMPGVADMLLRVEPPYILVLDEARDDWKEAAGLITHRYAPVAYLDGATLYRLTDETAQSFP